MTNEVDLYKKRVQQLESELDEMTIALSQAWDQLTPLLQSAPEQANSTEDIIPVLESIMVGIGANKVAVFMSETEECYSIPEDMLFAQDVRQHLKTLGTDTNAFQFSVGARDKANTVNWLFAPIIAENKQVGAIGVGFLETEDRHFTAIDVRILQRMAERTASQILAAHLAQSRQRELLTARELQIASHIQRSIQPAKAPNVAHLEVASYWQPAKSVGGDAWGWVKRSNGEIGCFILDVSGKGLPAALAAVSLHTALKMALRLELSATQVLERVNEEFYDIYDRSDLLATVCVMIINPEKRCLHQANAGHLPTLIRVNGEWTRLQATVPPIGTLPVIFPEQQDLRLNRGDLILCYSDGFTETENEDGFWGEEGLLSSVPPESHDVEAIVQHIVRAADQIRGSKQAHDDQTIFAIHMAE